jgi:serine/threonine-protein kinase HipA
MVRKWRKWKSTTLMTGRPWSSSVSTAAGRRTASGSCVCCRKTCVRSTAYRPNRNTRTTADRAQAQRDRRAFFRTQLLFWLLCAVDGHAKNFSVFIGPEGRFSLTPLYDVVSAYPIIGRGRNKLARQDARMAMAVIGANRHYRWDHIHRRHWLSTAARCGFAAEIEGVLDEIVSLTPTAIQIAQAELPGNFPSAVSEAIFDGILAAVKRIS